MYENINIGSVQSPYKQFYEVIPAGQSRPIRYVTDNFILLYASAPVSVSFGGSADETTYETGMGYKMTEPVPHIILYNKNSTDIVVHCVLGVGDIRDNRLTVSGTVITQEKAYDLFKVETLTFSEDGVLTISPAQKTIIQNTSSDTVYIGGTGTDGIQLKPQGTFEYPLAQDLVIYGTAGQTVVVGSFN